VVASDPARLGGGTTSVSSVRIFVSLTFPPI